MSIHTSPSDWTAPQCHSDFSDLTLEFSDLQSLAAAILKANPSVRVGLETPEDGLIDLRVECQNGRSAEVYSVPCPKQESRRRFAVFMLPETEDESESYFETVDSACEFLVRRLR